MNKAALLAAIRSGRVQLESALAQFSEDQLLAPVLHGGWSIKDLIAHIGFWEQLTALRFSALLRGVEPPAEPLTLDELNAQVYAQNRHKPLAEVRLAEQAAYEQLLLLVVNAVDDDLFNPQRFAATEGKPFAEWIENNTYGHYEEHQADFTSLTLSPSLRKEA
jgi:hypothetical protein